MIGEVHPVIGAPPDWLRQWTADVEPAPETIAVLQRKLVELEPDAIDVAIRFPPACAIQCACGSEDCSHVVETVAGYLLTEDIGIELVTLHREDGSITTRRPDRIRVVGYHAGITSLVMLAVLRPAGDA